MTLLRRPKSSSKKNKAPDNVEGFAPILELPNKVKIPTDIIFIF